jgi:hypothetical protein
MGITLFKFETATPLLYEFESPNTTYEHIPILYGYDWDHNFLRSHVNPVWTIALPLFKESPVRRRCLDPGN